MTELISTNPSKNYEIIGSITESTANEIQNTVVSARLAQKEWLELGLAGRIECLRRLTKKFLDNQEKLATLISQEMGMPLVLARDDIVGGVRFWNSYLDTAEKYLKPCVTFQSASERHTIHPVPYGVCAAIAPWNFPFSNFVWECGQSLVAGNTVVFKHSEETPLSGKLIEQLVTSALPPHVFNEIYGGKKAGECLLAQKIDLIVFTGSSRAGIAISELAAKRLIPTHLELGGSAPGIIFPDADLTSTVDAVFSSRFYACGQVCDGLKRLIVHESLLKTVVTQLHEMIKTKKIGDALDATTDLGPLASRKQLETLEEQVADALAQGATLICGGKRPPYLQGAYYEPTLLAQVTPSMRVWKEEVFGPVLPIVTFQTEEEALRLANDTCYGLGAYVFTQDPARFQRLAQGIESAMVSQNGINYVRPENFFGGCKLSGHGRTHAQFGFERVTQMKLIAECSVDPLE